MMMNFRRLIGIVVVLVAGGTCLNACSDQYSAAPMTAQVVDAETGQPLAGVNVVAHWQLEGGWEGGTPLGAVTAMEAETDDSGRFQFPAWGPKEVQRPFFGAYANARVRSFSPELLFFKSGYDYESLLNYYGHDINPKNMHSEWDGKTIKLKPFHGNSKQYAEALRGLSDNLHYYLASGSRICLKDKPCALGCQWQNIPKTIRAIGHQFKTFEVERIRNSNIYSSLTGNEGYYRALGCSSPTALLGEDLK